MGRKPRLGSAGADDSDVCQEPREARGDGDEYSCRPEHVPPVPERERARARERESASERESRHPPSPIEREGGGGGERESLHPPYPQVQAIRRPLHTAGYQEYFGGLAAGNRLRYRE